jgi:putative chitinase
MTDWKCVLRAIAPKGKRWIINGVADAMPQMIQTAKLTTPLRQAHFLAQCAHESDGFQTTKEYASGAAYEGRADLGNTQPGDGVRFKGRAIIQNTGRGKAKKPLSGYNLLSAVLGVDFVSKPELLEKFPYAALAAAVFWNSKALNAAADRDDVDEVTHLVNGGYRGLAQRKVYLKAAKRALAAPQPKAAPAEEQVTAQDLRKAGSRIMSGTSQIKKNLIGLTTTVVGSGATVAVKQAVSSPSDTLEQVSNATQTASNIASNVQSIHEATLSAPTALGWLHDYWPHLLIGANVGLALLCAWFAWRIFSGALRVECAKVDDVNADLAGGE